MPTAKSELQQQVGVRLRAAREALGRTQEEVAERAGFTGKYVSEIERGLRDVPLSTLSRIAEAGLDARLDIRIDRRDAAAHEEPPLPPEVVETARALALLPRPVARRVRALIDDFMALLGDDA